MNRFAILLAAASIAVTTAAVPAQATLQDDKDAVVAAMLERNLELRAEAADLARTLPSLPPAEQAAARQEIRMLQTRALQLLSLSRIVPRYNAARLAAIIEYFGLSVSPS